MEKKNVLELSEALDLLPRQPALLLGPDATIPFGSLEFATRQCLASYFPSALTDTEIKNLDPGTLIDELRSKDMARAQRLETDLRAAIRGLQPAQEVTHLVRAGWSACISLAQDIAFESALRDYLDSIPSSKTATVVSHPSVQPPIRTIPIYKLLGDPANTDVDNKLVLAKSDVVVKQQQWPRLLKTFPDFVRDAPLFVVGAATALPLLQKVLGTMVSMPKPTASSAMFLADDPALRDPTTSSLLRNFHTYEVKAKLREFCEGIAHFRPQQRPLVLSFAADDPRREIEAAAQRYSNIVSLVPSAAPANYQPSKHLNWLVDALFRPSSTEWLPFLCNLDLVREVTAQIETAVRAGLLRGKSGDFENVLVLGEAGVGKTSVLKRVACNLAATGAVVLWCRRNSSGSWVRQFRQLAAELSEVLKKDSKQKHEIVVICDDPWALRLTPAELMACFEKFSGRLTFLFALRNSDYYTSDGQAITAPPPSRDVIEVPFELSAAEQAGLAGMMVRIGAARDSASASDAVKNIPSPHARDVLCSLWYLVPETKGYLTESLHDQYRRLGSISEALPTLAQHVASASSVAQRAYEFVTVTSSLSIDLPIEVIVRALGVDYAEWLDLARDGRPLWGLLYDDRSDDESTIVYRTRNEVVTEILLGLVNGGVGHAGEQRVLRELLAACDSGTHIYRNFVMDVLVRSRHKLQKSLNFEQGMELFETARGALPHPDRVLEHHKGVWMASVGRDYKGAYAQFEKALDTPLYPGAERDSPTEHIHTSMAAAVVQMQKSGLQSRDTALEVVRGHLRHASSPTFFNPHTSHVSANMLFDLAKKNGVLQRDSVALAALSEALEEIERGIQSIGSKGKDDLRFAKDIHMLEKLKSDILVSMPDVEELKTLALSIYEIGRNQSGFEAAARKLLTVASHADKGKSYNLVQSYIQDCSKLLEAKGDTLSVEMLAIRIDLIIRWRLQRPSGQIDWRQFRSDLEMVLASTRHRDSLIKRFYLGVAQFQLRDVSQARASFSETRRLAPSMLRPNDIRCYLTSKEGSPRRVQCTFERSQGRFYATIPELDTDVPVRSPPIDGGPGSTSHCYVGFSLNGPIAVFDRPDDRDLLLA